MKKPFNPGEFGAVEDLPKERQPEFKATADSGFVRESALDDPDEAFESAEQVTLATVIDFSYEPGETGMETSVQDSKWGDDYGLGRRLHGRRILRGGYGTYITYTPSQFAVNVELKKGTKEKRVLFGRDIRNALDISRLTETMRDRIMECAPKTLEIVKRKSSLSGRSYFEVGEDDIRSWAAAVREKEYEQYRERRRGVKTLVQQEMDEETRQLEEHCDDLVANGWYIKDDFRKLAKQLKVDKSVVFGLLNEMRDAFPDQVEAGASEEWIYSPEFYEVVRQLIVEAQKQSK